MSPRNPTLPDSYGHGRRPLAEEDEEFQDVTDEDEPEIEDDGGYEGYGYDPSEFGF